MKDIDKDKNMNDFMDLFWHYDLYAVDCSKFDKLYDKLEEVIIEWVKNER